MVSVLAVAISSVAFASPDVPMGPQALGRLWDKAVLTSKPCAAYEKKTLDAKDADALATCRRDAACLGRAAGKAGSETIFALNATGAQEVSLDVAVVRRDGSMAAQKAMVVNASQTLHGLRILAAQACTALGNPDAVALDIGLDADEPANEADLDQELLASAAVVAPNAPPAAPATPAPNPPAPAPSAAPSAIASAAVPLPDAALAPAAPGAIPTSAMIAGAVGVVAIIGAVACGFHAVGLASERDKATDRPTWRQLQGSAETFGSLTNVAWVAGIAGLGAGGVLFVMQ